MVVFVVLVMLEVLVVLVERPKICQKPKTAMEPSERIFLLLKLGLHSPDYESPLPKHQSFIILIRNVISRLKLMHQATQLVESSAK